MRQDVFRGECFAVVSRDVNGARVAFAVCDVEVLLAVRFLADFQAGVGKLVAGQHDAVAALRVEVGDVAVLPAGAVVAVQQVGEGVCARAAVLFAAAVCGCCRGVVQRGFGGGKVVGLCAVLISAVLLCRGLFAGAVVMLMRCGVVFEVAASAWGVVRDPVDLDV